MTFPPPPPWFFLSSNIWWKSHIMQLLKVWFFQSTLTSFLLNSNIFINISISNVFLLCSPLEWDAKFYVHIKEYIYMCNYTFIQIVTNWNFNITSVNVINLFVFLSYKFFILIYTLNTLIFTPVLSQSSSPLLHVLVNAGLQGDVESATFILSTVGRGTCWKSKITHEIPQSSTLFTDQRSAYRHHCMPCRHLMNNMTLPYVDRKMKQQ
jgi:hypothetical protein